MASLPGALLILLLAAGHVANEWNGRTMKTVLTQEGRRWRVLAAKAASLWLAAMAIVAVDWIALALLSPILKAAYPLGHPGLSWSAAWWAVAADATRAPLVIAVFATLGSYHCRCGAEHDRGVRHFQRHPGGLDHLRRQPGRRRPVDVGMVGVRLDAVPLPWLCHLPLLGRRLSWPCRLPGVRLGPARRGRFHRGARSRCGERLSPAEYSRLNRAASPWVHPGHPVSALGLGTSQVVPSGSVGVHVSAPIVVRATGCWSCTREDSSNTGAPRRSFDTPKRSTTRRGRVPALLLQRVGCRPTRRGACERGGDIVHHLRWSGEMANRLLMP